MILRDCSINTQLEFDIEDTNSIAAHHNIYRMFIQ